MRRGSILITAGVVVALLAGCAAPTPEVAPDVATELQNQVVLVAEGAASGDHQAALDTLDDLQADLDEDEAASAVQPERVETIQSAIDVVRADLETLIAADEAEQAAQEAAEQAAEEAAQGAANTPEPVVTPEEPVGPGNSGNKGPGKDKGKNKDEE